MMKALVKENWADVGCGVAWRLGGISEVSSESALCNPGVR